MESAENVFVGVDMNKDAHYAQVVGCDGVEMFDRSVPNDEDAIRTLVADVAEHGDPVLVIDGAAASGGGPRFGCPGGRSTQAEVGKRLRKLRRRLRKTSRRMGAW